MRIQPMPSIRFLLLPLAAVVTLALSACSKGTTTDAAEPLPAREEHATPTEASASEGAGEHAEGEKAVVMNDAGLKAAGIRLATLQPSSQGEQLRAPGEVLDNAYGTTLITPRVEALVIRRQAKLGDEVRAGAPLVTLASVEVSDAQADLRIAEQEWRRVSALGREAVAGRRIAEAKVAVDRARAKAQAYGLPGTASGNVNGQFTLTAPHAGRITEDDFIVGERIEPGKALYRLVDESVVWVDAKLPSNTISRIKVGSQATVVAGGQRMSGTVMRAAHRTSEATRSASIRVEVPNVDDRLHGGDFVDVFLDAEAGAGVTRQLTVPTNAIVQLDGESVVFRRSASNALEPAPIRTGEVVGDITTITEGLKAGDTIVVEGAFAVKAQMLKALLGEGDAH